MLKNAILELTKKEAEVLKKLFDEHADEVSDMIDDYSTFFKLSGKIAKI